MRSLILAVVVAFGALTPIQRTPPAVRTSMAQAPITRAQALQRIARTGLGQGPSASSCSARVDMRDTDLLETRTVNPYTDPAPLQTIAVDFCVALDTTFRMENWGTFTPLVVAVTPRAVRFEASFDPAFDPAFEIVHVDLLVSPLGFVLAPFDGTLDFAGPSAASFPESLQALGVASLAVTDDSFFRSPFPVYFRSISGGWTVTTTGGGSFQDDTDTLAGGGLVFRWNQ